MLTLFTFGAVGDEPSASPFCVKAMMLLEMSGRAWQRKDLVTPMKMPHKRLPVLQDGAEMIADSAHIERHLTAKGADFYPGLDAKARGVAHAMTVMVEDNLRQALVHDRWVRDDCWAVTKGMFFADAPAFVRIVIAPMLRKTVRKRLIGHGIAQFSEQDRLWRVAQDLKAIKTQLGTQTYLFGNTPTGADAAVVPVLSMIAGLPCDTGLRRLMREDEQLSTYVARARAALYPAG